MQATAATSATVSGTVNPEGQASTFLAYYDLGSSTWCTSSGASGSPANSTTAQPLGFTDQLAHSVGVTLGGLSAGVDYCVEVSATNGSGSTDLASAGQVSFIAGVPGAATSSVTVTGAATATVAGSVNPAAQTSTYQVLYDVGSSTWCQSSGLFGSPANSTTPQTLGFTDASSHDVSIDMSGLSASIAYCAEVTATNGSGSAAGGQFRFTAGSPSATTGSATVTGPTTTVGGSVNPAAQTTNFYAVYDLSSSTWCTSSGASGSPANSSIPQTLGFTDANAHVVAVNLSGLTASTSYCAEVVASNGSATTSTRDGAQVSFTQAPIPTYTLTTSVAGAGTITGSGISCPGTCSLSYGGGTGVSLVATPAPGSVFAGWSGACTGSGACNLTMNAAESATATFTTSTPPPAHPQLTSLRIQPKSFRAAKSGASVITKKAKKTGSVVSYQDSQAGLITFTVRRATAGVKNKQGICGKPSKSSPKQAKPCIYYVVLGKFTHSGTAGGNSFNFTGRLSGHSLKPGKYQLLAVATDQSGLSSTGALAGFQIKK